MIDVSLNRRLHNFLGRLLVYFARPEIFDDVSLMKEADTLMGELDNDRSYEVKP